MSAPSISPWTTGTATSRPDGYYHGAGLSYGYVLPFARHWAAETTVGAGMRPHEIRHLL